MTFSSNDFVAFLTLLIYSRLARVSFARNIFLQKAILQRGLIERSEITQERYTPRTVSDGPV